MTLKLSGLAQIQSLFGKKAWARLAHEETNRMEVIIGEYDAVIACQKDAYHGVKSKKAAEYKIAPLIEDYYRTEVSGGVPLYCVLPTYLFMSRAAKRQLLDIRREIMG